jgi:hypothetical protein
MGSTHSTARYIVIIIIKWIAISKYIVQDILILLN